MVVEVEIAGEVIDVDATDRLADWGSTELPGVDMGITVVLADGSITED